MEMGLGNRWARWFGIDLVFAVGRLDGRIIERRYRIDTWRGWNR